VNKIGIRRENHPGETRSPLMPANVESLLLDFGIDVEVQKSKERAFKDKEYAQVGARLVKHLSQDCVVFGIKDVALKFIQKHSTYFFFSHTHLAQECNRAMLQKLMRSGCNLFDYELMTTAAGEKLSTFGRFAGIVGMVEVLRLLGKQFLKEDLCTPFVNLFTARLYQNVKLLKHNLQRQVCGSFPRSLTSFIIGIVGNGRMAKGALEVLNCLSCRYIKPEELFAISAKKRFRAQQDIYVTQFTREHTKDRGLGRFLPYLTVLINATSWKPWEPPILEKLMFQNRLNSRLRIIGDFTCDINGGNKLVNRTTTFKDPIYWWKPKRANGKKIMIMAIDNLPSGLARESSESFSKNLSDFIPLIYKTDFYNDSQVSHLPVYIKNGMILFKGCLTAKFEYLR